MLIWSLIAALGVYWVAAGLLIVLWAIMEICRQILFPVKWED